MLRSAHSQALTQQLADKDETLKGKMIDHDHCRNRARRFTHKAPPQGRCVVALQQRCCAGG